MPFVSLDVCRASRCLQRMYRGFDFRAHGVEGFTEVIGELHTQPITRRLTKIDAKMKVGFSGDPTFSLTISLRMLGTHQGRSLPSTSRITSTNLTFDSTAAHPLLVANSSIGSRSRPSSSRPQPMIHSATTTHSGRWRHVYTPIDH